jgi:hypothetical protein
MKISDIVCPLCGSSYLVAESTSASASPGNANCAVCGTLPASWHEPRIEPIVWKWLLNSATPASSLHRRPTRARGPAPIRPADSSDRHIIWNSPERVNSTYASTLLSMLGSIGGSAVRRNRMNDGSHKGQLPYDLDFMGVALTDG